MAKTAAKYLLDFEKPLVELEQKLDEMRAIDTGRPDIDLSEEIHALEGRVEELRASIYHNLTRWQRVQIARHPLRPYTLDHIEALANGFVEMRGDRTFRDDPAIVGGLATFQGARYGSRDRTVMLLGHQKGRDTKSRKYRRFGMPNPEGYRKALRLMKMAAKFNKPVITLLDTPGAYPGMEAEERGQAEAIARNLFEMAQLRVPIVCVVIGEGASGGAIGIGLGDRVSMLENTWYSVISPESCSSILWRSWDYKEQAAEALKLTADHMHQFGLIDEIIKEPLGGAQTAPEEMAKILKRHIKKAIAELQEMTPEERIEARINKYRNMGVYDLKSAAVVEEEKEVEKTK